MKHCKNCNTDYAEDLSFCTKCGGKLEEKETPTPPPAPSVPPVSPVSPPVSKPRSGGLMVRIFKRVVAILAVIAVGGYLWWSHYQNATTYMRFNTEGELFAKGGGSADVNIDYDGNVWEVSYKPSWITINDYGDKFRIYCEENQSGRDREDHITIKSGKVVQTLPVGQFGSVQYMRLSEKTISSDAEGGYIYIDMDTDGVDPKVRYPRFCEIEDLTSEGFTVRVKKNTSYSRTGTITISEDDVSASIYVTQSGKCRNCNGKGRISCSTCGGSGYSGWGYYQSMCYACGSAGTISCYACGGDGEQ